MTSDQADTFAAFMERRLEASTAFVSGDVEPLRRISTATSPATLFPPPGVVVQSAKGVNDANAHSAASFRPPATNDFEVLHQAASDTLAYWVGIQRSEVHLADKDEPVPMALRITEIFRREAEGWLLIHRHADPLADD